MGQQASSRSADHGQLPTPAPRSSLGPDGGHLVSVSGVYLEHDWDPTATAQFIGARAIAPFYRGLQDDLESGATKEDIDALLDQVGKPAAEDDQQRKVALASLPDRRKEPERHRRAETLAYQKHGTAECPICFLYYPANMNMSRCCDQPICTECFVQIKRIEPTPTHLVSEPVGCPYCQEADFGVIYQPPAPALQRTTSGSRAFAASPNERPDLIRAGSSSPADSPISPSTPSSAPAPRRKSMPAKDASVVSVDKIHPNWQAQLDAVRATAARRAARRIVFRQVNGTLQPVGITSARDVALAAQAAEAGLGGDGIAIEVPSSGRRSGRRRPTDGASYLQSLGMTGADLEAMMIAEAMRLSLADEEDRQRRDQQQGSSSAPALSASAPAAPSSVPSLSVRTEAPTSVPARTSSATPVSASDVTPRGESRPPLRTADSAVSDANSVHSSLNYEPARRDDDSASFISNSESIVPLRPRSGSLASSHR